LYSAINFKVADVGRPITNAGVQINAVIAEMSDVISDVNKHHGDAGDPSVPAGERARVGLALLLLCAFFDLRLCGPT